MAPRTSTAQRPRADRAIRCLIDLQARARGDALIGRALFPLVSAAGYADVHARRGWSTWTRAVRQLVEGFTKLTFTAMVEGVRDAAIAAGMLTTAEDFDGGVADLYRTAGTDGTFCYTFFKATAVAPAANASGGLRRSGWRRSSVRVNPASSDAGPPIGHSNGRARRPSAAEPAGRTRRAATGVGSQGSGFPGAAIVEVPRHQVDVEVRHRISEQVIVHVARREHLLDHPARRRGRRSSSAATSEALSS